MIRWDRGGERSILHFNVADFAVAVERAQDSTLNHRPLIVASGGGGRSLVYDMSEEAYGDGVRKGMMLRQATRICRSATLLAPKPERYRQAMALFFREIRGYSPLIEAGREDGHFFVDITGTHRLYGHPADVGWRIRRSVRERLGMNPIWTLGGSQLVAKVASRLVKPVGEYIVSPGEEEGFLAPLSITLLPGLTSVEQKRLLEFQVGTIGSLAGLTLNQLAVPFGRRAGALHALSRGLDGKQIQPLKNGEHVALEHHFAVDTNDRRQMETVVGSLADQAGVLLRKKKLECRRLGIWVTYSDGPCLVRQSTRRRGTASDFQLRDLAHAALDRALTRRVRVRSCRLVCDRLLPKSPQLSLFPEPEKDQRRDRLQGAMDGLQGRFGQGTIHLGQGCGQGVTLDVSSAACH